MKTSVAWIAAGVALAFPVWAQPGRLTLKSGELLEAKSLRMEEGAYRLTLADGKERTVPQGEVRHVQFLEDASEIGNLVKDLGAEDFGRREAAVKRLVEIGRHEKDRVLAALPKDAGDPEIRARSEEVRRSLDADGERKYGADDTPAPPRAPAAALYRQMKRRVEVIEAPLVPVPVDPVVVDTVAGGGKEVAPAEPGEIERLMKDLGSERFEAREAATERLKDLAGSKQKEEVLKALPADVSDPEVRSRAEAIGQAAMGGTPRRAGRGLQKMKMGVAVGHIGPEDRGGFAGEVRLVEADLLVGDDPLPAIIESIAEDLEDPDAEVRADAVKSAGNLTGENPKKALAARVAELLGRKDAEVRSAAAQALGQIAGEKWSGDEKGVAAAKAWWKAQQENGKK